MAQITHITSPGEIEFLNSFYLYMYENFSSYLCSSNKHETTIILIWNVVIILYNELNVVVKVNNE